MSQQLADRLTDKIDGISSYLNWWAEPCAGIYYVRVIDVRLPRGANCLLRVEAMTLSDAIKKTLANIEKYGLDVDPSKSKEEK